MPVTAAAQAESQIVLQQLGMLAQTQVMVLKSLHPGESLALQQGPSPVHQPQSSAQVSQLSVPLHRLSPQIEQSPQP